MTNGCAHEPNVRRAAAEDRWTDALRRHIDSCEECAAAVSVSSFMLRLARVGARQHVLPDPAVIWLKANLLRGSIVADRASRPLNVVQMLSYLVVAAGWAALLTWKWADLSAWILSATPAHLLGNLAGTGGSLSATIVLFVGVLSSLTVLVGLHAILAEE